MSRLLAKPWVRDGALGAALLCAVLSLTLWPQDAMEAARSGLALCGNVIIPSLFPFFVLSSLVVELGLAGYLGRLLEGVMRPLFRVNGACASAVALGFIGGYPVGARTALSLYEKGMCTRTEAQRLLAFCNNSGPGLYSGRGGGGRVRQQPGGRTHLPGPRRRVAVCGTALSLLRPGTRSPAAGGGPPCIRTTRFSSAFTGAVTGALRSTLNICAFVVFFLVVVRLLTRSGLLTGLAEVLGSWFAPLGFDRVWAQRLLTGLLEMTSGVCTLSGDGSLTGRLSMAAFLLGWAGVSVHCQVLSFLGGSGLSAGTYLAGKLLHGILAALFTGVLAAHIPLGAPVAALLSSQADDLAALDFHTALTLSTAAAWITFLAFLLLSAAALKKAGHPRRPVV